MKWISGIKRGSETPCLVRRKKIVWISEIMSFEDGPKGYCFNFCTEEEFFQSKFYESHLECNETWLEALGRGKKWLEKKKAGGRE
jgi:hypothetical protein